MQRLLIANRGEIAIRIARAAAELGIESVAVYSTDDARSLHVRKADHAVALQGRGATAYLDIDALLGAARAHGCDAVHPGYGFLAEDADLARRTEAAGLIFVGPTPAVLERFGDKAAARRLAAEHDVPVLAGTESAVDLDGARAFAASLPDGAPLVIKAVAGGGGRGLRVVTEPGRLADAFARATSEARAAFGDGALYAEQFMPRARHVEVQIVGDGTGEVMHLFERECSLQRRHQKLIEIAPSPSVDDDRRRELTDAAMRMASAVAYRGLGTFEFLIDADGRHFAFIETNARLQVEHTVTEEITGIDLVQTQLEIARGRSLGALSLIQRRPPRPRGYAIEVRINLETMQPDGGSRPTQGTLTAFEPPGGPGVRTETFAYAGYTTTGAFDPLLAKIIVHTARDDYAVAARKAGRALAELRIEGVDTNRDFLAAVLRHPDVRANAVHTRFIDDHAAELLRDEKPVPLYFAPSGAAPRQTAKLDRKDPLAVLEHGRATDPQHDSTFTVSDDPGAVAAPMLGTIVALEVSEGHRVRAGQPVLVMEAMKMEHVIEASVSGRLARVLVAVDETVAEGQTLFLIEPGDVDAAGELVAEAHDPDHIRPDLAEALDRHAVGLDGRRPDAVARRRKTGQRTARENLAELLDPGSFVEYGPLVIAAQRRRRPLAELIERTPADGMIAGIGRINGALFDERASQAVVLSYDYTVLAGTQGQQNHRKKDRLFEVAEKQRLPVVFFTEGGGGRPGDTDGLGVAGLDCWAFTYFAELSGLVPLIGITSGRCFAGNAVLLGCCDVIIATQGSNIGIGGPAMIEGGGLGVFRPEEVGPMYVQVGNGVVDVAVADEAEAVAVAKRYLSFFQGRIDAFTVPDQRRLRSIVPENRLRIYDMRQVIDTLADEDSVLEIRRHFGHGIITSLARIEGRPVGIVANNPRHLAGAIDREGADKGTRFMQLCDAFDIPIVFLCDCPGIMVGPEIEKTALVRHASRMFVTGASLTVPFMTIVLRKAYGLGAQAMAGGSFKAPIFTVSWPTGEFGGMGLEGAVKLGYRNDLAAIESPEERKAKFDEMVERMYQHGKAVNTASHFEIDDVIDPADSRKWVLAALRSAPPALPRHGKKRPCVDTW